MYQLIIATTIFIKVTHKQHKELLDRDFVR